MTEPIENVERADGERIGRLVAIGDLWSPQTTFGGILGPAAPYDDARELVERTGMASLLESWWIEVDGEWVRHELVEVREDAVRLREWTPYSLAIGSGTDAGRWIDPRVTPLHLKPPA